MECQFIDQDLTIDPVDRLTDRREHRTWPPINIHEVLRTGEQTEELTKSNNESAWVNSDSHQKD